MVDGATRLLAIVGDPITQVRSPIVYNAILARAGVNAVLVPWHAPAAAFDTVFAGLLGTANLDGIVVTYPFKQRALRMAATAGPMARLVGAANALRRQPDGRWTADMFDGIGLLRALEGLGQGAAGRHVTLLGAGGAGCAIAFALAEAGAASIAINDTDNARPTELASRVAQAFPACRVDICGPSLGHADLLINATPVGLSAEDGTPIPLPTLSSATTVIDIVPRQGGTRLLDLARERGCPHTGGAAMVDGQARAVLDFFGFTVSDPVERAA